MERITPRVQVDGRTVDIEGWMFILACAFRGIPWAITEACDPNYNMRGKIQDYERRKNIARHESRVDYLMRELELERAELSKLKDYR